MRTLRSQIPLGERLLLFGGMHAGKTTVALQIARACPASKVFIIDAEQNESVDWLLYTEFADVAERGNVVVRWIDPNSWEEWVEEVRELSARVGRDDWLVIDPLCTWQAVQEYHLRLHHGEDWVEYYEQVAKRGDSERLDGWKDWTAIKARHDRDFWRVLRHVRGHILVICRAKQLGDKESKANRAVYGPVGMKPEGQELIGHWPHTAIYTEPSRKGFPRMTVTKDRGGRGMWDGMEVRNFPAQYLVGVAGWKSEEVDPKVGPAQSTTAG